MDGLVSKDPYKPYYVKIFEDKRTMQTIENVERQSVLQHVTY